ncbi:MAG: elongation factor G [Gemmatimonadetes bacterium]|nr:elongation factor G [Gemmatimonadota bacterium]
MAHTIQQVRNIALTGHSGSGKTCLAEAMLYCTGALNRLGRTEEGTTVSDFDPEEIERRISLRTSLLMPEWDSHHFNVLDTPGYADFAGEVQSGLRVADGSIVVVESVSGVDVGTERAWRNAEDCRLPRVIFVNKMDRPDIDLDSVMEQIRERFGRQAVPLQHPLNHGEGFSEIIDIVKMKLFSYTDGKTSETDISSAHETAVQQLREQLVEAVAESDEALMEKYFEEGGLDQEELEEGLRKAVLNLEVFPVLFGDSYNAVGMDRLLDTVVGYFPSPSDAPGLPPEVDGQPQQLKPSSDAELVGLVFKTLAEQHVGELSLLRLYSGSIKTGDEVSNPSTGSNERIGQMFELNGNERTEVEGACAGDIVALVKMKDTHTGNTLRAKGQSGTLPEITFPDPLIRVAITAKEKGSEERMVTGLQHLRQEDPTFIFRYDGDIRQSVLQAQGDLHLGTITKRLRERFGVEMELEPPRIPYKETIRGNAESHYRHKKQTGGRGQFAEVYLRIAPKKRGEGFEFLNEVVGGSIPSNFIPAVEKGIQESLVEGPLCGSQVVDVAISVYDGKHHAVDSDEVSFKLATSYAFRDAFLKAKPVLLEPIYSLAITVPAEFMGDVMADLNSRRGRINGTEADGHFQIINADAPLAEIDRYATTLRSMTQGKGIHTQTLDRYEQVPGDVQSKVVAAAEEARAA